MPDNTEYLRIVAKYRRALFKYCYYRLNNDINLTDETVNDIFFVLSQKWSDIDVNGNISAYLYRVADNCIKHNLELHKRYYNNNESLEEAIENHKFDNAVYLDEYFSDDSPEDQHIENIRTHLPEEYRDIFTYRFIEKRTLEEVADMMKIPYSTLRLRTLKVERLVRAEIKKIFQ